MIYANKEYEILYCLLMKFTFHLFTYYVYSYLKIFPKLNSCQLFRNIFKICVSGLEEVKFTVGQ